MHPLEGEGLTTENDKAMGEAQINTSVGAPSDQAALRTSTENGAPEQNGRFAKALRGFGPLGILAVLVIFAGNLIIAPLSAVLVLVWAKLSRTPWREIGYVRPRSWIGGLVVGIGFGILLKFLMKMIVMPLLGADPINQTYHYLAGNPRAAASFIYVVTIGAGFGEETFFRGYLFERLGKLFGPSAGAKVVTVLLTSVFFGSLHYHQGLAGVEQATIVGLVFGTIFAVTGRIWMLMCAHAAFDLTALALIYWDLESAVAHFVFK
jgi:membrane protease YdiL (CAAX protease family)